MVVDSKNSSVIFSLSFFPVKLKFSLIITIINSSIYIYIHIFFFPESWVLNLCVCVCTLFLFPFGSNKHNEFWFQAEYQVGISNSVSFPHQFTYQAFFILWWVFICSKYVKKKVFQLYTCSALNWSLYICHLIILKFILWPNKVWIVECRIDFGSWPT